MGDVHAWTTTGFGSQTLLNFKGSHNQTLRLLLCPTPVYSRHLDLIQAPMFARTRQFFKRRKDRLANRAGKVFNTEEIRDNWSLIQRLQHQVFRRPTVAREETFRHAYRRLQLTETDLAASHQYHLVRFYIFATFASLALGSTVYSLVSAHWFGLGPSLGALILMGALAFQASFRLFQIERRELVPVSEWFSHPGSWVPAPFQSQSSSRVR